LFADNGVAVTTEAVSLGMDGQQMAMPRGMAAPVYHVDEDTGYAGNKTFGKD
jgi:hypothetical protein